MTNELKTRNEDKGSYRIYLQKAEEFIRTAEKSAEAGDWNAAAINSVHCVISAVDACCVKGMGKRSAEKDHLKSADLITTAPYNKLVIKEIKKKYTSIVRMKNMAAYEGRLIKPKDGQMVFEQAKQVFESVNGIVE